MLKAVIFDIDGVLIDSLDANLAFFNEVFEQAGYKKITKNQYKKAFHLAIPGVIRLFVKNGEKEFQRIENIAYKTNYPIKKLKVTKNSVETVKKIAKKYKMALVTSRIEKGVENYFKVSKTKKYFKIVVHLGHYKNPKPHPEPLLLAAKRLNVKPEESVYVGDTQSDIQSAKSAGMKMILYSKKKLKGADHRVDNFKKLLPVIEKL